MANLLAPKTPVASRLPKTPSVAVCGLACLLALSAASVSIGCAGIDPTRHPKNHEGHVAHPVTKTFDGYSEKIRASGHEKSGKGWVDERDVPMSQARNWTIISDPPKQGGLTIYEGGDAWTNSLRNGLNASSSCERTGPMVLPTLTQQLQCYANEQSFFFLEYGARPSPAVEQFIAGRCGVTGMSLSVSHRSIDPRDVDREVIVASEIGAGIKALPKNHFVGFGRAVGLDRAVYVMVSARRDVEIEPYDIVAEGSTVTVHGKLPAFVYPDTARATRGDLMWRNCDFRVARETGDFSLRCRLDPSRQLTFIDIPYRFDGEWNRTREFRLMIAHKGEGMSYLLPNIASSRTPKPGDDRLAILHAVNVARWQKGSDLVREASVRSVDAESLWADPGSDAYGRTDFGTIRYRGFNDRIRTQTREALWWNTGSDFTAGRLIDEGLADPGVRALLLEASVKRVALTVRRSPTGDFSQVMAIPFNQSDVGDPSRPSHITTD